MVNKTEQSKRGGGTDKERWGRGKIVQLDQKKESCRIYGQVSSNDINSVHKGNPAKPATSIVFQRNPFPIKAKFLFSPWRSTTSTTSSLPPSSAPPSPRRSARTRTSPTPRFPLPSPRFLLPLSVRSLGQDEHFSDLDSVRSKGAFSVESDIFGYSWAHESWMRYTDGMAFWVEHKILFT